MMPTTTKNNYSADNNDNTEDLPNRYPVINCTSGRTMLISTTLLHLQSVHVYTQLPRSVGTVHDSFLRRVAPAGIRTRDLSITSPAL